MTKDNKKFISIKVTIDYQSYRALLNEAERQGLSLNDLCVQILLEKETEYILTQLEKETESIVIPKAARPLPPGLSSIVSKLEKELEKEK